MTQSVRGWVRSLHLYLGMAAAPFLLIYAVSTLLLNHPDWLAAPDPRPAVRTVKVSLSGGTSADSLALGREVLRQTGVRGEIMFVERKPALHRLKVPVQQAGRKTSIEVNLSTGTAVVRQDHDSLLQSLVFHHKMPGPHVVAMRGNSAPVALWRWLADATVCAAIFLAASGTYLWLALRAERRLGTVSLVAGAAVFMALVVGIVW